MKIDNAIFVQYAKLYINPKEHKGSKVQVATLLKNLESIGFALSPDIIEILMTYNKPELKKFYESLISGLKKMVGDHRKFEPMYPNFPKQVMEASEVELYFNAMMHYIGKAFGLRVLPQYVKEDRKPLNEKINLKLIKLGTKEEYANIFYNLMSSKTSISQNDIDNIKNFIIDNKNEIELPTIFHKEIMANVIEVCLKKGVDCTNITRTATDVLRVAVAMTQNDITLKEKPLFNKFKRKDRRMLLHMLNKAKGNIIDDMMKYQGYWIRLGEKLHPGEYMKRYPQAYEYFNTIRNENPTTFNGHIEQCLLNKKVVIAANILSEKPGEFARRLDHLLRLDTQTQDKVLEVFQKVVDKISTPVLWQLRTHFQERNKIRNRIVFPKGSTAKVMCLDKPLTPLTFATCGKVIQICDKAIQNKYKELPSLGKVYIDEELQNYTIPFSQRSASNSLKTISRGSCLPLGDKDVTRFFIWWKGDDVDLDLTATMHDENYEFIEQVSYTHLKGENAVHSGDITSAPQGACEFIDVKAIDENIRYVVMNVFSFSRESFNTLEECFAGWMTRESMQSGEIFEAKTVENKFDITSNSTYVVPIIIDIKEKLVYWADLATTGIHIHGSGEKTKWLMQSILELKKPNLYQLFLFHTIARGEKVDNIEDADVVFSVENEIQYDINQIVGKFL